MGDQWPYPHSHYSLGGEIHCGIFGEYAHPDDPILQSQEYNHNSQSHGYGHSGSSSQFYEFFGINNSQYFLPTEFQGLSISKSNATEIQDFHNQGGDSSEQQENLEESSESVGKELDILSKLPFSKYKSSGSSKWWGKSTKNNKCEICKSKYRTNEIVTNLPCGHKFHEYCLYAWFKDNKNCSICNEEVVIS